MKSIMEYFRPNAQQTPLTEQGVQQTQNGQQATPGQPAMQPATVQGSDPAPVIPKEEVSPMDAYKELWQPVEKKEGAAEEFNPSQIFKMDPEAIQKALSTVDFTKSINQEQAAAIQAGGTEAFGALTQILNSVARETMGAATTASAKMIEQALTGAQGSLDRKIDQQVRQRQVSSHFQELNPALSHPAAAPMMEALKTQFTNKYPMASPQEIATMTAEYAANFANMMSGKPKEETNAVPKGEVDWNSFMSS